MNQGNITPSAEVSFKDFLFKDKRNRTILILAGIAVVIQWSVFKYFYPFASFIHGDSFSYINAADQNLTINTYLIGYSKFLRLFSIFAKPDIFLVSFQYLLIQSSVLFLLFTIFYFYKSGKTTQYTLFFFMVFNPLFWHLANLVSSDGLFLVLSMIWLALLLWIMHAPSKRVFIWHAAVIFIAFTVRYNAMIYPIISAIAFWLSNISWRHKLAGFTMGVMLCGLFIILTSYEYKKLTGYWQYSPFSGWQMTNNAMYAYRYVDKSERKNVPQKFQILDSMIRQYFDSTRDINKHPQEALMASTVYMWTPSLSLYKYRNNLFIKRNDSGASELKKWASMGPLYKNYGIFIIKQYPIHYLRYFIWPNANKYYAPPIEFLEDYNSGVSFVTEQTKRWFGYKTMTIKTRFKSNRVWILNYFPILGGVVNVLMLCAMIYYLLLNGWRYDIRFRNGLIIFGSIWILNAAFTITASSAALRFQSFPITLSCITVAILMDWMIKVMLKENSKSSDVLRNNKSTQLSENALA
ncbi:hypothetical protein [Longitalea arenae]|uniref:hypothetical protein n=1 Tax=Longitalea arenae TaxID=2812558 RepID=UPI0019673DEE|nr:hypothetical protein [Longitalea arenae]